MKRDRIEPLYRRVNTRTHHVRHAPRSGEARWERNTKSTKENESMRGSMHPGHRHGLDYTPLFRFLLSRVGQDWDAVHSEAVARLDRPDPIFWMVALQAHDESPFVCIGQSSWWSGLRVDDDNRLVKVAPDLTVDDMEPDCSCCTHTFNGVRFTRPYAEPAPFYGGRPDDQ
jgi:hypothetical protein